MRHLDQRCLFGNLYVHIVLWCCCCVMSLLCFYSFILCLCLTQHTHTSCIFSFLQINVKLNTCHTKAPMTISDSMWEWVKMALKVELNCVVKIRIKCRKRKKNWMYRRKRVSKREEWMENLHATSMVADWLFAFPRGDHAWQSHLNGDLPKYSKTKSFDMVAVTSCNWTPVCGSTCESNVDGGGCELPLHLNVSWKWKNQAEWRD